MDRPDREEIVRRLGASAPTPQQQPSFFDGLGLLAEHSTPTAVRRSRTPRLLRVAAVVTGTTLALSSAAYAGALGEHAQIGVRHVLGHGKSAGPHLVDHTPVPQEKIAPAVVLEMRRADVHHAHATPDDSVPSGSAIEDPTPPDPTPVQTASDPDDADDPVSTGVTPPSTPPGEDPGDDDQGDDPGNDPGDDSQGEDPGDDDQGDDPGDDDQGQGPSDDQGDDEQGDSQGEDPGGDQSDDQTDDQTDDDKGSDDQ